MIDFRSFRLNSTGTGYISVTEPEDLSPAYIVAYAARRMLEAGDDLSLPAGYDLKTLEAITWALGAYDEERFISGTQAHELAQIGRELLQSDKALSFLTHEQKLKIEHLIRIAPQD